LFGPDFEAIEAIGAATSVTEFQQLLDDLDNRRSGGAELSASDARGSARRRID
jgi:hypothetical protein